VEDVQNTPESQGLQQISSLDNFDTSVSYTSEETENVTSPTTQSTPPSSSSSPKGDDSTFDVQDSLQKSCKRPRLGGSESSRAILGAPSAVPTCSDNRLGDRTANTRPYLAVQSHSTPQALGSQNQHGAQHAEPNSEYPW